MARPWLYLVTTCLIFALSLGALDRDYPIYEDSECLNPIALGMQSRQIPDENIWASSIMSLKRAAHLSRLGQDDGAWTALTQNSKQYLGVDLGRRAIITSVITQGRCGSDEYVTEFKIEFSDDNSTWREYNNKFGMPETFNGNVDDNNVVRNSLRYPLRAQFIRFVPQRWSESISMRLELMGCEFQSDVARFDGGSLIAFDLSQGSNPVHLVSSELKLRFRTSQANGIIFYTDGNQGDYFVLELKQGYLYFNIDLGSTQTSRGATQLIGGSLLDDYQWHDVIVVRKEKEIAFIVDRMETRAQANGSFVYLDLDKQIYLGGVPRFNQNGMSVRYNFSGCIENVAFDNLKMIRDAKNNLPSFSIGGAVGYSCSLPQVMPVTFPTANSYIKAQRSSASNFKVNFEFRTHNVDHLMLYHALEGQGYVSIKMNVNGLVSYTIQTTVADNVIIIDDVVRNIDEDRMKPGFNDGMWHKVTLSIDIAKINCTVDRNSRVSYRTMPITTTNWYYVGGSEDYIGFFGCMRNIFLDNQPINLSNMRPDDVSGADLGSCGIRDRCNPTPCEHGGICSQDWTTFSCNCDLTGYKGGVCHISSHPLSCVAHRMHSNSETAESVIVDLDGSGPLKPFPVVCAVDERRQTQLRLSHNSKMLIPVNGYQEPGSYVRKVRYDTGIREMNALVDRAYSCKQYIEYRCNNSKLLATPNEGPGVAPTYGWWVGRTFQPMYYWGGAAPGSRKCACGLLETNCDAGSLTCNCDAGLTAQTSDKGYLEHKEYLPVLELHFGDTGTVTDKKIGYHMLNELLCEGDNLFDNVITFRKADATIMLPTFEAQSSGDIWFQFRTTASDGVMIHNIGNKDFIQIGVVNRDTIQFRFDAGNGIQVIEYTTSYSLNDDEWHTVHIERNRKQAWLRVDTLTEVVRDDPQADGYQTLDLTGPMVVGSTIDFRDGFVGCMRGLMVNGLLMDMRGMVVRGEVDYGVSQGCVGKCMSNPCMHGGTCQEGYSGYTCDCFYTPWRGWMCGREVGVNLQTNYMVMYEFKEVEGGVSTVDFTNVIIGFSTKKKQGILLQITSTVTGDYITVEMNNNGGVKVAMDLGFTREEINTPNEGIDFANGQQHEVTIRRSDSGRRIILQVDDYKPRDIIYILPDGSDTVLDKPTHLFVGRNTSSNVRGFEGCIFRMQVDNIFPLKRAFQDPRPSYITLSPLGEIHEDMCGYEEITQPPDPIETRPPDPNRVNITYPTTIDEGMSSLEKGLLAEYLTYPTTIDEGMSILEKGLLAGFLALGFFILIILLIVFIHYYRDKGDYKTHEDSGARNTDNADVAVMSNTASHDITKRQEFFI